MMARKEEDHYHHHHLRALAARAVTDSLKAAAGADRSTTAADRAARFEDCVRSLEAEKAKMEVFRRELPISVHLVADGTRCVALIDFSVARTNERNWKKKHGFFFSFICSISHSCSSRTRVQ